MDVEYFRTLYDYSYWARDRLLKAMDGMAEEEYARPNGFTYGSIAGILAHIEAGERLWLARWRGETPPPGPPANEAPPGREALTERWRQTQREVRSFLDGLNHADLKREVRVLRRDGSEASWELWQLLAQIVNHGTQHRSEAAEALTMTGRSPGNLDLLFYFLDTKA